MAANRYHAGLMVLVFLLFGTFGRCTTELSFLRSRDMENDITLRCRRETFDVSNARFYVSTPEDGRRLLTQGQPTFMFTLTPETEGNFTCYNPTTDEFSEELLLAGELPWVTLKFATEGLVPLCPLQFRLPNCAISPTQIKTFFLLTTIHFFCFTEKLMLGGMHIITGCSLIYSRIPCGNSKEC